MVVVANCRVGTTTEIETEIGIVIGTATVTEIVTEEKEVAVETQEIEIEIETDREEQATSIANRPTVSVVDLTRDTIASTTASNEVTSTTTIMTIMDPNRRRIRDIIVDTNK